MTIGRRQFVTAAGLAGISAAAGCIDGPDLGGGENQSGSAAFFAMMDWGNAIGGDALQFESPVEVGEMGHGWDPDADIVPTIAQHDVFLYLGTPEFQWAINAADELADSDITVIDGLSAISQDEFLSFTGTDDAGKQEPVDEATLDPDTTEIAEFEVIIGDEITAYWHGDHWDGSIPDVPLEDHRRLGFNVIDTEGNALPLGGAFEINARIADGAPDGPLSITNEDDSVVLQGREAGQSILEFEVVASGDVIFDTTEDAIVVTVAPADDIDVDAFHDPHVWTDPVLAQSMVEYIADTLGDRFPDSSETFRENAEQYQEQLRDVDAAMEQLADEAVLDVAVVVAHDSFQYLEARYGFDFRTPTGVTPDAAQSIEDVASLAATIEEFDIDTILFDPFEAPNPDEDIPQGAQVLLEETRASNAVPISALEGITPAWKDAGYGWIEQMEEINIPALQEALKVP